MLAYYLVDFDPFIFRLWDNIGPRWYGLAYVLAFGCAYWVYRYLARRGYADLSPDKVAYFVFRRQGSCFLSRQRHFWVSSRGAARLRPFLQIGDAAGAIVDLARVGGRH